MGHVIDVMPTILEIAGAPANDAPPLPGRSLVPAFAKDGSVTRDFLFFHHEQNRALRMGDWKIVSAGTGDWELYDLKTDRAESHNLAAAQPDRVQRMAALWQELQDGYVKQAK